MKKGILYCLLSLMLFGVLSCKKGDDDPVFTVLSRKARLSGEWHLKEGKLTVGTKFQAKKVEGLRFKFSQNRYTLDEVGKGAHSEGSSSLQLFIKKEGSFEFKQNMDTIKLSATGSWDFLAKSPGLKNKEVMSVKLNSITGFSGYFVTFNKSVNAFIYKIKELRNKKLVLIADVEMIDLDPNGAGYYVESEYTFEQ
jgi:hypothetical protein